MFCGTQARGAVAAVGWRVWGDPRHGVPPVWRTSGLGQISASAAGVPQQECRCCARWVCPRPCSVFLPWGGRSRSFPLPTCFCRVLAFLVVSAVWRLIRRLPLHISGDACSSYPAHGPLSVSAFYAKGYSWDHFACAHPSLPFST